MLVPIGSACDVARIIISREDSWQLILERKDGENAFCLLFSLHSLGYLIWKRSHVRTA